MAEIRLQLPPQLPNSGVYFVRSGDLVKIGRSSQIGARLRGLLSECQRAGWQNDLSLLGIVVLTHVRNEETAIKHELREFRTEIGHEWFRAEPEVLAKINGWLNGNALPDAPPTRIRANEYYWKNRAARLAYATEYRKRSNCESV